MERGEGVVRGSDNWKEMERNGEGKKKGETVIDTGVMGW